MKVQIRLRAEADLDDAWSWYEDQREGLGDELLLCVEAALDGLKRHPLAWPVVHLDARRAQIKRFPYAIIYRVRDGTVVVLAFPHASRDPRSWQSRV